MKHYEKYFLFLFLNFSGIIIYKIINNKKEEFSFSKPELKRESFKNNQYDLSYNYVTSHDDVSYNSIGTQTDVYYTDMLLLLEYKTDLENIYDDNKKYEWKLV